jgi:hypothetical protein
MKVDWSQLKYLTPKLNWGEPEKMSPTLLYTLDSWCIFEKKGIFVTPHGGTLGKHATNSLHGTGKACDFIVLGSERDDLLDLYISLSRFPFTEIGIYPNWKYNEKVVGGFHVGLDNNQLMVRKKLWIGISDAKGNNNYIGISKSNLQSCKVI